MSASPDDMPELEVDPLLFRFTHLSEAASTGSTKAPKRKRNATEGGEEDGSDEESDFSHDSDDDDSTPAPAASPTAGMADHVQTGRARAKKEADVNGVALPEFPLVQTIHATAFLGREVDVKTIARRCINAVYCPPSCVRFTIRNPFGTAMVYSSGKYVCLGGKSTVDMLTIARKVARKIQRMGNQPGTQDYQSVGFFNFKLNNISASGAFGFRVNLRALSEDPSFMDYTEYEPEQWKGLHYKLPVDPTKTLADLLPSYAYLLAQRNRREQFSSDEFLGRGEHALIGSGSGALSYYATTGTAGNRAPRTAASAAAAAGPVPFRLPPSLHGQILTATIFANGRVTLTGVRKEKDVFDAYLRLFRILQPFATTLPPNDPPTQPPYPRIFLPGQRRLMKLERAAASAGDGASYAAAVAATARDVKPNLHQQQSSTVASAMFVLPAHTPGTQQQAVHGTFAAAKSESAPGDSLADSSAAGVTKSEPLPVKSEVDPALASAGNDAHSAIVLEGLPEEAQPAAAEEDVEWE